MKYTLWFVFLLFVCLFVFCCFFACFPVLSKVTKNKTNIEVSNYCCFLLGVWWVELEGKPSIAFPTTPPRASGEACAPGTQLCRRCCSGCNWSIRFTHICRRVTDDMDGLTNGSSSILCGAQQKPDMSFLLITLQKSVILMSRWIWPASMNLHIRCLLIIWRGHLPNIEFEPPSRSTFLSSPVSESRERMSYGSSQKVQKVMVQPINLIFRFPSLSLTHHLSYVFNLPLLYWCHKIYAKLWRLITQHIFPFFL